MPVDLSAVLPQYHSIAEVFSKDCALSLPLHRPYDCAIDLVPGAKLPTSKMYKLSKPEREANKSYLS